MRRATSRNTVRDAASASDNAKGAQLRAPDAEHEYAWVMIVTANSVEARPSVTYHESDAPTLGREHDARRDARDHRSIVIFIVRHINFPPE